MGCLVKDETPCKVRPGVIHDYCGCYRAHGSPGGAVSNPTHHSACRKRVVPLVAPPVRSALPESLVNLTPLINIGRAVQLAFNETPYDMLPVIRAALLEYD